MKFSISVLSGVSRVRSPQTEPDRCNKIISEDGQDTPGSICELKTRPCEGTSLDLGISDLEGCEFDPLIKLCPPYSQVQIRSPALIFRINDDLTDEMSKLSAALSLRLSFHVVEIFY